MNSNVLLDISFDGKNLAGWESNTEKRTLSDVLKDALWKVARNNSELIPCATLVVGCHAVHFYVSKHFNAPLPDNFLHKINRCLPEDVSVRKFFVFDENEVLPLKICYAYHFHFEKQPFLENRSFCLENQGKFIENLKNSQKGSSKFINPNINIQLQIEETFIIINMDGPDLTAQTALQIATNIVDVKQMLPAYGLYATHAVFSEFQPETVDLKDFFIPESICFS